MPALLQRPTAPPAGESGFSDLLLAGETLRSSRLFKQAKEAPEKQEDVLLALKRRMLVEPPVVHALDLLTKGLERPAAPPRAAASAEAPPAAFALLHDLAALLEMQQYVYLSLGRVADGLETARLCVRFGRTIGTADQPLAPFHGTKIAAACLLSLGKHLDQLAVRNCERLQPVCAEWLRLPDPYPATLEANRRMVRQRTAKLKAAIDKNGIQALADFLALPSAGDAPASESAELAAKRRFAGEMEGLRISSPALFDTVFADAQKYLDQLFDFAAEQAKKPLWQRTPVDLERDQSQPARLAKALFPLPTLIEDGYAPLLARVRLLACHAAIRRYRWEEDRLPPGLEALNLAETVMDPYTGQSLEYRPAGKKYRLASAGPLAAPDDPKAANGRLPISVVPGE